MADSPLWRRMKERAKTMSKSAIGEILTSEDAQGLVGAAVRGAQTGRRLIDENASQIIGAVGLASQADLERIAKKIGRLRKRMTALIDQLEDRQG
jgi:polyhydroxyalkanoate synthesis regulator phasin